MLLSEKKMGCGAQVGGWASLCTKLQATTVFAACGLGFLTLTPAHTVVRLFLAGAVAVLTPENNMYAHSANSDDTNRI